MFRLYFAIVVLCLSAGASSAQVVAAVSDDPRSPLTTPQSASSTTQPPRTVLAAHSFDRTVKFCNRTRAAIKVAAAYDRTGTSESTSAGWFIIQPCRCGTVISDSLRATEVFLFAARLGSVEPLLNDGRGGACVHPTKRFNLIAQNTNAAACAAWGGKWVNFKWVDTAAARTHTHTLRETNACNL